MKKLSSKERILRTVAGQEVDRIPIWPPIPWHPLCPEPEPGDWKTMPNYREIVPLVREHCDFLVHFMIPEAKKEQQPHDQTAEEYARRAAYGGIFDRRFFLAPPERIEAEEHASPDGTLTTTYTIQTPEGELTTVEKVRPGIDTTWLVEPVVKNPEDCRKLLSIPNRFDRPDLEAFFRDAESLGDEGVPVCFVTTPMVMVSHMTDLQRFLEWSVTERPLIERLIETAYERIAERLYYCLEHGVDCIFRFGGSEQATPPLMSRESFVDFILKYEKPLWQMVKSAGQIAWVHCHGKIGSVLAGFAFAKYPFPGRKFLFPIILATMMVPFQIRLIPSFILIRSFGWLDTFWALIIPGAAEGLGIFLMRQYMVGTIPDELMDAARIDGCRDFQIYYRIALPMVVPGLVMLGLMTFMQTWNSFLWPFIVIGREEMMTATLVLPRLADPRQEVDYGVVFAATTITALPILALFLGLQKRFISGLMSGFLKG